MIIMLKTQKEYFVIYRYMQKSDHYQSSIAEEQHLAQQKKRQQVPSHQKIKYANVNEIKSFERLSQVHNLKLIESQPFLFSQQQLQSILSVHFVSSNEEQSFCLGEIKQDAKYILEADQDKLTLKIAVSNIRRQNRFILGIRNLKRRATLQLLNIPVQNNSNPPHFKYTLSLRDTNLLFRVFLQLDSQFKVWKEIQVPLSQNKFTLEVNQYNNQQTDIKINDFLFHLVLKMPFHQKINYCLLHHGNAELEKVQFISKAQKRQIEVKDTDCSKECQLI